MMEWLGLPTVLCIRPPRAARIGVQELACHQTGPALACRPGHTHSPAVTMCCPAVTVFALLEIVKAPPKPARR